jgi:hypothetical protein
MWRDRHKIWFTDTERARLEALGDEMAAAMETDTTPKGKNVTVTEQP